MQSKLRARDVGIEFEGTPGPLNAITDVSGRDWSPTLVSGSGALRVGQGPVRTGRFEKFGNTKAVRSRHSVYRVWLVCGGNSSKGVYLALERTRPVVRKRDWLLPDPQSVRLSSGFSLPKSIKNVIVRLAVVCPKASEC